MAVAEKIEDVELEDELRVCPSCGYEKGFHVSYLRNKHKDKEFRIVLICPSCGYRLDVGWKLKV